MEKFFYTILPAGRCVVYPGFYFFKQRASLCLYGRNPRRLEYPAAH